MVEPKKVDVTLIEDKAVALVKAAFSYVMAANGGGRGGIAAQVLRQAQTRAQAVACAYADLLQEVLEPFDSEVFFMKCCLDRDFIEHMAKSRRRFEKDQEP